MVPVLKNFVLPHATPIAFLVAYGELAIGVALVLGILVRPASICGVIYMVTLCFRPIGPQAAFWQYFGASLEHLVLAPLAKLLMIRGSQRIMKMCRRGINHLRLFSREFLMIPQHSASQHSRQRTRKKSCPYVPTCARVRRCDLSRTLGIAASWGVVRPRRATCFLG
jgi:hypothetical protein